MKVEREEEDVEENEQSRGWIWMSSGGEMEVNEGVLSEVKSLEPELDIVGHDKKNLVQ